MKKKFLEEKVRYEKQNPLLPEKVFSTFEALSTGESKTLYSLFYPASDILADLIADYDNILTKTVQSYYFDIPAEDETEFASNAYWYNVANKLQNPVADVMQYDEFISVDFDALQALLNRFPPKHDKYEFYISPYIEYFKLTYSSSIHHTVNRQMLNQEMHDITECERKDVLSIVFFEQEYSCEKS